MEVEAEAELGGGRKERRGGDSEDPVFPGGAPMAINAPAARNDNAFTPLRRDGKDSNWAEYLPEHGCR